jgi:geranylgeranyl pyrophosphate synthase
LQRSAALDRPAADDRSIGQRAGDRGELACPAAKPLRERLRALAADLVSTWKVEGLPATVRSAAGLRSHAEPLVRRAGGGPEHVGWAMVTIVSEYWRDRIASGPQGRRLLLLPDCQATAPRLPGDVGPPRTCGPSCSIATIWAAARDSGWAVEPTARAVSAIGSLVTGQYDGVLGVARLGDLEKAFGMLPAFSLPVAAVPFEPAAAGGAAGANCATATAAAAIDVDWVLGLLGVAGPGAPVGDYLPLLREAAGLFTSAALGGMSQQLGFGGLFPASPADVGRLAPLDATADVAGEFLTRGGKFLRPFITLAAFDAVVADRRLARDDPAGLVPRHAVQAAAVAIEVFHKASLVHDDIEDDDRMRYGRPTVHVERGVPTAINVGDYLVGAGYRIVAGLPGVDDGCSRDLVGILSDAHVRLARGQGAELWWRDAADKRLLPDEALTIYGLKTSPAFEAALRIGVRLAGPLAADVGPIDRYALHVGIGFQVLNDLKDWSGDLENDRTAAGDLLGGRPTLMWALALERLSPADADRLMALGRQAATAPTPAVAAAALAEARLLYERADVFRRAVAIVDEQRSAASAAVASCRLPRLREVLEFLLDLAVPEGAAAVHVG